MASWMSLEQFIQEGLQTLYPKKPKISVGMATCGRASGAQHIYEAFAREVRARGLDAVVAKTGCLGFCQQEPLVSVQLPGCPRYIYARVDQELVIQLLEGIASGRLSHRRLLGKVYADENPLSGKIIEFSNEEPTPPLLQEHPFYATQVKIATRNCGIIDPSSIAEYTARGGYQALYKALQMEPKAVIEEIAKSGLRGRGGGGFPTGRKWSLTRQRPNLPKYIICNADEGDPGAYMDRSILEGDPHTVIEGMAIGAYAIGAEIGIIYVRAEYPLAVATIQEAIAQAEGAGFLGENILGSGFSFRLKVVKGQGAFVCGEETALIASIEGKMGEPQPRPPYPAEKGLWGQPTCINNVETWANVPVIICRGAEWFSSLGTETSKGTKVFALVGNVRNNGLVEVPMGTSLRQIVEEIGGGTGRFTIKAVQTGGPSGGCIPAEKLELPVDYEALTQAGSIMGSGGMVVMDERTCMVDVARYFLTFTQDESCGKCLPCREGTKKMLTILTKICEGKAEMEDLEELEELAWAIKEASLCGLGQTAPNPVLSTLKYFRKEYEIHIKDRFCPAGVCRELFQLNIDPDRCTGCGRCKDVCPQEAITGEKEKPHHLDSEKCIRCRSCLDVCRNKAVKVVPRGR
ncbi:MAG: NADH-ubiquinone oxidoreductase-F iron-sulfur binding region domain-containing protein [Thermacetogeniaceae bacterium]